MGVLEQLKASALSEWLSISLAGFPTIIALHSVGMAVVTGLSLMVTLRLHRALPGIEPGLLPRLLDVAAWGFVLNLATGLLIFITRGPEYITSAIFLAKMLLVIVGTSALFELRRQLCVSGEEVAAPAERQSARTLSLVATVSLFGAVITGRLIAYLSDLYR